MLPATRGRRASAARRAPLRAASGSALREHRVARLVVGVLLERDASAASSRAAAGSCPRRAGADRSGRAASAPTDGRLLLLEAVHQVVAVRDAVAVGDDQRRARVGLGLAERAQRVRVVGAHRDAGDVDVPVGVMSERPGPSSAARLPPAANLATAPRGVAFDIWPPVFEYTSVSSTSTFTFGARGEHVVEAAEADVVRPAVAADDPDARRGPARRRPRRASRGRGRRRSARRRSRSAATRSRCAAMPASVDWSASSSARHERVADARREPSQQLRARTRACLSSARRMPRPNSALSSKSELAHAGPRPSRFVGPGRRRQVAAVDRRAAGRVGDRARGRRRAASTSFR